MLIDSGDWDMFCASTCNDCRVVRRCPKQLVVDQWRGQKDENLSPQTYRCRRNWTATLGSTTFPKSIMGNTK